MLLFLLILLFPSQLSHHFWPSWSLINGIRSDYLSPTLYLTDILIILLWFFNSPLQLPSLKLREGKGVSYFRIGVAIFITLNIFFSLSPLVSVYKWIRIYEYYWLFKYLISRSNYTLNAIRYTLSIAVVWTSFLAWSQFVLQRSVGALWYWLGERTFSISTPGISRIFLGFGIWDLGFVLRPYATMPHPNALAGFLLVAGLIIFFSNTSPLRPSPKLGEGFRGRGIRRFALILALLTIPLTFSKSAILIEVGLIILWLVKKYHKLFLILFILPMVLYFYLPSSPNSIPERILLNQKAVETIQKLPLFGVGLGNSVSLLPSLRQPTHNIFLLLIAELGLPMALAIGYWSFATGIKFLRITNYKLLTILVTVLATGMVDHYWVTLHQNILLLILLLALIKIQLDPYHEPRTN